MLLPQATRDPTPGGFTWTQEGELVYPAPICDKHRSECCGCARAFAGLVTGRATTRAMVCDVPIGTRALYVAIYACLERGGWVAGQDPWGAILVAEVAEDMTGIGKTFPQGTTLARRGDVVYPVDAGRQVIRFPIDGLAN